MESIFSSVSSTVALFTGAQEKKRANKAKVNIVFFII
jgi:hypothetical protein